MYPNTHFTLEKYTTAKPLIEKRMAGGKICTDLPKLADIRSYTLEQLKCFDPTYKRIINPHIYKISLSTALKNLKYRMIDEFKY